MDNAACQIIRESVCAESVNEKSQVVRYSVATTEFEVKEFLPYSLDAHRLRNLFDSAPVHIALMNFAAKSTDCRSTIKIKNSP